MVKIAHIPSRNALILPSSAKKAIVPNAAVSATRMSDPVNPLLLMYGAHS